MGYILVMLDVDVVDKSMEGTVQKYNTLIDVLLGADAYKIYTHKANKDRLISIIQKLIDKHKSTDTVKYHVRDISIMVRAIDLVFDSLPTN